MPWYYCQLIFFADAYFRRFRFFDTLRLDAVFDIDYTATFRGITPHAAIVFHMPFRHAPLLISFHAITFRLAATYNIAVNITHIWRHYWYTLLILTLAIVLRFIYWIHIDIDDISHYW